MANIIETCFHHNVFTECKFCYPIYERGIREGMERAAGIAEDRAKDCISGCCKWTAKEIRSAKEKL